MPLPVIHSFAGYSIYKLSKKNDSRENGCLLLLSIFLANLADFDFLPGVLLGKASLFHRGLSHSVAAALICAALTTIVFILISIVCRRGAPLCAPDLSNGRTHGSAPTLDNVATKRIFALSFIVYLSHIALDFFCGSVPILWPFSAENYSAGFSLFSAGHPSLHAVGGLQELILWFLTPETMHALFFEMAVVFSIWAIATFISELRAGVPLRRSMAIIRSVQAIVFFVGFVIT